MFSGRRLESKKKRTGSCGEMCADMSFLVLMTPESRTTRRLHFRVPFFWYHDIWLGAAVRPRRAASQRGGTGKSFTPRQVEMARPSSQTTRPAIDRFFPLQKQKPSPDMDPLLFSSPSNQASRQHPPGCSSPPQDHTGSQSDAVSSPRCRRRRRPWHPPAHHGSRPGRPHGPGRLRGCGSGCG